MIETVIVGRTNASASLVDKADTAARALGREPVEGYGLL